MTNSETNHREAERLALTIVKKISDCQAAEEPSDRELIGIIAAALQAKDDEIRRIHAAHQKHCEVMDAELLAKDDAAKAVPHPNPEAIATVREALEQSAFNGFNVQKNKDALSMLDTLSVPQVPDAKEIIDLMAQAIAGIRWDKIERPAGNTQGREDYSFYLKGQWIDEATAAYKVFSTQSTKAAPQVSGDVESLARGIVQGINAGGTYEGQLATTKQLITGIIAVEREASDKMREALMLAQQSIYEISGSREHGPAWFTEETAGMNQHIRTWCSKGLKAISEALATHPEVVK